MAAQFRDASPPLGWPSGDDSLVLRQVPEEEQPTGTQTSSVPVVDEQRVGLSTADRQETCL